MRHPLLSYVTQEAVQFLLQLLLQEVPVCPVRHDRQQGRMPVLQQPEDQRRQAQVPLSENLLAAMHTCTIQCTIASIFAIILVVPNKSFRCIEVSDSSIRLTLSSKPEQKIGKDVLCELSILDGTI
jgi:hypothetical protein